MPAGKTLSGLHNEKARSFFSKGAELIERSGQAVAVTKGSPEFAAWQAYFHRIGWTPLVMKMVADSPKPDGAVTMPTQWPEWFDSGAAG